MHKVAVICFLHYNYNYDNDNESGESVNLIEQYLDLVIRIVTEKDFAEKIEFSEFRREYNNKVSKMIAIAAEIENEQPELKEDFCKLLFYEDKSIRIWVAHHILELMNCKLRYRKLALREIRKVARTDISANGFGEKIWLKDWYKHHRTDRWLR